MFIEVVISSTSLVLFKVFLVVFTKITFMFIEVVISSTSLVLFKVFLVVFTYDFEQATRARNE